jgi:hypothetical protein
MVFYRNNDFNVDDTNIPVKLERPEGHIPMTPERFQYILSMQDIWRKQYISNKRKNLLERRRLSFEKKYTEKGLPIPVRRTRRGRPNLTEQINDPFGEITGVC